MIYVWNFQGYKTTLHKQGHTHISGGQVLWAYSPEKLL